MYTACFDFEVLTETSYSEAMIEQKHVVIGDVCD